MKPVSNQTAATAARVNASLEAMAKDVAGRCKARTLDTSDLRQVIREALKDGYGYTAGATVANAYRYQADRMSAMAARRTDGSVALALCWLTAKKSSSPIPVLTVPDGVPRPRQTDQATVKAYLQAWANALEPESALTRWPRTLMLTVREAHAVARWGQVSAKREADALALAAGTMVDAALLKLKQAGLPELVPVTLADSAAAGNCDGESKRIAGWFGGREAVPASELLAAVMAREPHLLPRAIAAVAQAARAVSV